MKLRRERSYMVVFYCLELEEEKGKRNRAVASRMWVMIHEVKRGSLFNVCCGH